MATAQEFLTQTAVSLKRMTVKLNRLDGSLVESDIAARRIEADIGLAWAKVVDRIEAALKTTRSSQRMDQWVKATCGVEISTMRRRKRLHKHWREYEAKRRELGQCGQSGLKFGLSLVSEQTHMIKTNRAAVPVRSVAKTIPPSAIKRAAARNDPGCQFITGDSVIELPKLKEKLVNSIVTSPPYWPAKRTYHSGQGIGHERSLQEYIGNLVAVFDQAKRVLRDDGTLWILIGDSYRDGDLLFIPNRLAMAMQANGWVCRCQVIWQKTNMRPENVTNRPSRDYETLLMFTKHSNGYYYDTDPIRVPLVKLFSVPGKKKAGMNRSDVDRTERIYSNPMGRNSGSVWLIAPTGYRGDHAATMPEELVRRCLLVSCPENSIVLDPFGGAGTVALVANELGHRAISIEISPNYTKEARKRLEAA